MPRIIQTEELVQVLLECLQEKRDSNNAGKNLDRILVGIAGPPGTGKTTLSHQLKQTLNEAQPGVAAVFGMDGFHFDDLYLDKKGWRAKKGAPHTFDVGGFSHMLARLKSNDEDFVAVPLFDRDREVARAGAEVIGRGVGIVLTEGNYLLLNKAPWSGLAQNFDLSVMVRAPMDVLENRLRQRWVSYGMSEKEIASKLGENDLPNVYYVLENSMAADFEVWSDRTKN